ncbi:MAG: hypothetical protein QG597_879 [Actinomycetota bacterium]|nr:hypothetical protein [Actinomycetota bacterium]
MTPSLVLPDLTLSDLAGTPTSLRALSPNGPLVVVFAANHCKYVSNIEAELGQVANEYARRGVTVVAICSSDAGTYPEDTIAGLTAQAARAGWEFPYLLDPEQRAVDAFDAACTPDIFVFTGGAELAYRGAFDASTPGNGAVVDGAELRRALDLVLEGAPVPPSSVRMIGCSIR